MNRTSSRVLRGAALALALGLVPVAGAWAQQSITIPNGTTVTHTVCGNGNTADNGNTPCDPALTTGNTVTVASGGTVTGVVYGALNSDDANGVTGNRVEIGGTVNGGVYGGNHMRSGTGDNVTASNNTVSIVSGSVVSGTFVVGGLAYSDTGTATASGNTVEISGGTVTGAAIQGGYAQGGVGAGTAANNTVTVKGTPTFTGVTALDGGWANTSTGNTLNLHTVGLTVGSLHLFQNLNFYLPTGLVPGGNMLSVTNLTELGTNAVVEVNLEGAGPALHTGDTFNLIAAGTMTGSIDPASASGVLKGYNYTLAITGNNLVLTIGNPVPVATSTAVPTMGEYTLAALAALLAAMTFLTLRRKA